ncbi:MAG: tetratricopeptide repeat protein [Pirellulaceae bacterium]
MTQNTASSRSIGISLPKKLLFATVVTVGFFGLLEGLLVLGGVGASAATADPYVGFSNQHPLFVPDDSVPGNTHLRTADSKLVWFNDQRFAKKKPTGVRRVFCVGGSTTFGRPYSDTTSFCGWLREFLPIADDTTQWEVINAGGVSYASYRVAAVMDELAQYEPDLFIVYTGQNEFLERRTYAGMFDQSDIQRNVTAALQRTRIVSVLKQIVKPEPAANQLSKPADTLPGEVDEMLNHTVGPADYHRNDKWHADVLRHYQANLSRMTTIAKKSGAEILFVVPASNEKDCSPFKSELNPKLDETQRRTFQQALDAALSNQNPLQAIDQLRAVKTLDKGYAEADYQIGKRLFAAQSVDDARSAFQVALDNDVCPLRATSDFQSSLRNFAKSDSVMLVDFDQLLRAKCQTEHGHSILGEEYFLDHVHPTVPAHQQLSLWILAQLQDRNWLKSTTITESQIARINKEVLARLDPVAQGVALRNLAKVLHWAGKFSEAAPRARDALRILPNDPESLLVLADCLCQTDQVNEAVETYDRLLGIAPMYTRAFLPYGELLVDLEAWNKAEDILAMAVLALPAESASQIRAQYFLGVTYLQLNDFRQADSLLSNVDNHYPDDLSTLLFLAQGKAGLGESNAAIEVYQRLIKLSPSDVEARNNLGVLLLNEKRIDEARTHFESVIKLDPENAKAKANLQIANQLSRHRNDAN